MVVAVSKNACTITHISEFHTANPLTMPYIAFGADSVTVAISFAGTVIVEDVTL